MAINNNSCVTLCSGGFGFFHGACAQKILLNRYANGVSHAVILEDGAYPDNVADYLDHIGFVVHLLPPLRSLPCDFAASRWPRTFTKLHLWNLPYDKVVYMDADAIPCASLDEVFGLDHHLSATLVKLDNPNRFRSGMMVLRPDPDLYGNLLLYLNQSPEKNGAKLGDQGVLNLFFKERNGFNPLAPRYNECNWKSKSKNILIAHLRPTPWSGRSGLPSMAKYVSIWRQALKDCEEQFGMIPIQA
jgi:alpha-N-acetylglucosamine transferase